ncbi:MAG TPA: pyridoxine 5'-phosphate synthase, partial [Candidatus Omnitrophota bacterium]|nr:pyridoxine 5'-phosphate synthase [Candidatus Omnitrophota bacterium]
MVKLGVNIDHIASVRQLRRGTAPDPVDAARICEKAGADSIVVHLREDRRHINDADVAALRESVRTRLNLEMSIDPGIVDA